MKLFRLIGTMTIVAAVAATMAVSASAEAVAAEYNAETGKVAFNAPALDTTAGDDDEYTVMVVSAAVNNDVTEGDIFQLAQGDSVNAIVAPTEPGKYYATIGGYADGVKKSAEFVVPLESDVVEATIVNEIEDDAAAEYYTVDTEKVPSGLMPWWTAMVLKTGESEPKYKEIAATNAEGWANIEGSVKLYLVYQGNEEATLSNVKLIWK